MTAAFAAAALVAVTDRLARNQVGGATRVVVHKVYPLDAAPAAFADFGAGSLGKLVISAR
jgi:NADPH:quinone reductase